MERIPASERTREKLRALMDGRSEVEDGRSELVRLAVRLIIEEALEGEARDALGCEYYARGAKPGAGYRNGYRPGRVQSAEGAIEYSAPHRSLIGTGRFARAFGRQWAAAPRS
jgi:putative transposase